MKQGDKKIKKIWETIGKEAQVSLNKSNYMKEYLVTLYNREDLEDFYNDMETINVMKQKYYKLYFSLKKNK